MNRSSAQHRETWESGSVEWVNRMNVYYGVCSARCSAEYIMALSLSTPPSPPCVCVWVLWIHASKVTRSRNVAILLCSRSELIYVIGAWVCAWHKMITFKRRWQRASEILMLVGESMFLFLALNTLRSAHSTPNANANAFIPWFIPIRSFYM